MFKKKAASGAVLRAVGEQVQRHGTTQHGGSSSSSRSTTATTAAVKPQRHSATKTATAAAAAARDATRLQAVLRAHTAPSALLSSSASLLHDESFAQILESVRQSTASYTDLDEVLQTAAPPPPPPLQPPRQQQQQQQQPSTRGASPRTLPAPLPAIVTFRTYMASLTCAKKFYLTQHRSDLLPRSAISDLVHYDDTVGFNELARRWDRLQFGSKAVTVHESNFAEAVQRTEQLVTTYFNTTYASLREQAPPLTLHRPAFEAPFGVDDDNSGDESSGSCGGRATQPVMVLRARPCVLRFRPQDNQWVLLEASATIDPTSTTAKTAATLQRLHFSAVVFRHWVTQPHIPIALRKRFLQLDLDGINAENAAGHVLERSARIATPIDLKRSGLLHIRQFFPGPATLLDCDPTRLVKFVHRLSLEELLLRDRDTHRHPANAFDLPFLPGLDPRVLRLLTHPAAAPHGGSGGSSSSLEAAVSAATTAAAAMSTTHTRSSSSSARQREHDEHRWFDVQQQLMEALLRHHTLPLVHRARNAAQAARWSAFARDCRDGTVCSAYDAAAAAAAQEQQQQQQQQQAAATQKSSRRGRKSKAEASPSPSSSSAATSPEALTLCTVPPTYSEHLGVHCSRGDVCPFFAEGLCLPQRVHDAVAASDNHLFTLPSSSMSRKVVWWREGLRTIRDVLYQHKRGTLALTAPQLRYVKAVAEGCIALNPHEIDAFFDRLRYPVFVIDFEAVQFALPPFTREVAYQSVPFQFSLDVFQRDVLTETPRHYDFLHFGKGYSPNDDPRKACIDELMRIVRREREVKRRSMEDSGELARLRAAEEAEAAAAAGGGSGKRRGRPAKAPKAPKITRNNPPEGPATPYDGCFIAHFASFEKTCLEKLGQLEEQYKNDIKAFYFLDTMELIKRGFIHPNAHGSNSLKKVLPALCPEFQYGVFGTDEYSDGSGSSSSSSSGSGAAAEDVATSAGGGSSSGGGGGGVQDVQRGDNAMGLYRLWYHQEGGGTIQELQRSRAALHGAVARSVPPASQLAMHAGVPPELREAAWAKLRIQLLEYCSLDTRGLYEIMREMWRERDAARGVAPADKTGWVYVKPTPREVSL